MAHILNPVLFYEGQGQTPSKECEQLSANDFAVGIQTPLQADMLMQFSFESVVCVDSTHGTNGYDFNLVTLVVVDEHGEGFPVAWCISNREDKTLIQIFCDSIKTNIGTLSPKYFMSDLAEQFYSAWTVAFYNTKPHKNYYAHGM